MMIVNNKFYSLGVQSTTIQFLFVYDMSIPWRMKSVYHYRCPWYSEYSDQITTDYHNHLQSKYKSSINEFIYFGSEYK
jgi:hypothetical protein